MKFLINELNKYVDISKKTNDDLINIFTSLAFEVEKVIPANIIKNVKLAKIKECKKHPNADSLSYLKTEIKGEIIDVVCGGKNVSKGQIVAHAIPGSQVGDLKLEPKELRGIVSNGMILSISEIMGISKELIENEEKENIYVFDEKINVNNSIEKELEIEGSVFDLSILPDRQYASSYFSMAREIAAFLKIKYNCKINEIERKGNNDIILNLGNKSNGIFATNVVLKKSKTPFFIKRILYHSNIKPTNTIKDVVLYVMLMTGSVTYVIDREKSLSLDGRKLNKIDLFNSDAVLNTSKDAMFVNVSSRVRSNIMSEKEINLLFGTRNIKGTTIEAAELSSKLIIDISKKAGFLVSASKTKSKVIDSHKEIKLTNEYINNYLGIEINLDEIDEQLLLIGIKRTGDIYSIPSYRQDILYKADIIEEIARFYGIQNIEPKPYKITNDKTNLKSHHKDSLVKITNELVKYGMIETKTFELVASSKAKKYNLWNINKFIELTDDYSLEFDTLQTSLMAGLIDSFVVNHKNNKEGIRLFELSNVFHDEKPIYTIGIIHDEKNNDSESEPILFTKELALKTLESIDVDLSKIEFRSIENKLFNPCVSSGIYFNNNLIGIIGEVHPSILRENKLIRLDKVKAKLYYVEIKLENVF